MPNPFDRQLVVAAVVYTVVILAMQWAGGAFQAEFCGASDEAAHYVTSLLIRDYAGLWPHPQPMPWAVQYYIHYPKVALGHWPPVYFVGQAAWWLLFPSSRTSAMLFNAAVALAVVLVFFLLARRIRNGWPAFSRQPASAPRCHLHPDENRPCFQA